jgi:hypothetical protein
VKKIAIAACLVLLAGLAFGEVSDTVWKALLHKTILVEKNDGSGVSGELSAYDAAQVVVIKADGTPVTVDRKDVKSVKVQTGSAASQAAAPQASAPEAEKPAPQAPAAVAAPAPAPKYHMVMNFNPLGVVLSSILASGLDFWMDMQFPVSKVVAVGVEPEILVGYYSGFGLYGGALFFPLSTAPEGLFIRAYGGVFYFDGYIFPELWGTVGYQFIWSGFVFSPEIGYGLSGFRWALNIGFAV